MSIPSASTNLSPAPTSAKLGVAALLIPVVLSTAVTLVTVGGFTFWIVKSGKLAGAITGATASPAGPAAKTPPSHVVVLEPMVVNLSDGQSYLRAGVSVRVRDEDKAPQADAKAPEERSIALRDTTLTVLSGATADSLLAPGGREALKKILESAYSAHNEESHVLDVYFTEFLVQRG